MTTRLEDNWGHLRTEAFVLPSLTIMRVDACLKENVHIRHYKAEECSAVHSCFLTNGTINSSFHGMDKHLTLRRGLHNFVYKPVLNDDHFIEAGTESLSLLHLEIDRNYYLDLLASGRCCEDLKSRIDSKQPVSGGDPNMAITPAMQNIIHDIMNCPLQGPLGNLILEAKSLELMAWQLHQYNARIAEETFTPSHNDRDTFFGIKDYLERTFHQEHSLRSLSREFGLNEFKLKKGFRQYFGTTVFGYIHQLKMQHARTMIGDCRQSVSEAAARTGYKNANHFSAAFKRQFGYSPSSLRHRISMKAT